MTNEQQLYLETFALYQECGAKFTMDELANRLSISKKTLYELVRSKEDLVQKALLYYFDLVAAEQAGLAEASSKAPSQAQGQAQSQTQPQTQTQTQTQAQPEILSQKSEAAPTSIHGAATQPEAGAGQPGTAGGNAFGFAPGGQNGQSGMNGQAGQGGHEDAMAELMGKIRFAGRTAAGQAAAGHAGEATPTLAAADAPPATPPTMTMRLP